MDRSNIILSVLIPSLPERLPILLPLAEKLNEQIGDQPVELIIFTDNRRWPLGAKRNLMMSQCSGRFLTHLDDDDDVSNDYIASIVANLLEHSGIDVLCFNSLSDLDDGMPFVVKTGLDFENEQTNIKTVTEDDGQVIQFRPDIQRKPWHWCVFRSSIARQGAFPDKFLGEDWDWLQQVLPLCKREVRLDRVLHRYYYRKNVSLS